MKKLNLLLVSLLFVFSYAGAKTRATHYHYYGKLRQNISKISPQDMKMTLTKILNNAHIYNPGQPDTILNSENCSSPLKNCYRHKLARFNNAQGDNSYRNARHVLYKAITPIKVAPGLFNFNPIYFDKPIMIKGNDDFRFFEYVNKNNLNCEHLWPQSKFGGGHKNSHANRYKKSDLHHLYPANKRTNSNRGSFPFGEVKNNSKDPNYGNVVGRPTKSSRRSSGQAFMPIPSSRGRVARAIMYFSTRYNMPINSLQEYYIRKWHREYPVTKEEVRRNNLIFKYQHVRNPFVDYPKLESLITNF